MDDPTQRTIDALENNAAELERLRILKVHELGVVVEPEPDPYVRRVGSTRSNSPWPRPDTL
jgi:hypothetical protein